MLHCAAVRSHRTLLETGSAQSDSGTSASTVRERSQQAGLVDDGSVAKSTHTGVPVDSWWDLIEATDTDAAEAVLLSSWCALLGAELALFHEALKDPGNQQFVLASHDAVPLKSFRYIYDDLITHSNATSKLCFASSSTRESCPYKNQDRFLAKGVAKHHEWLILSRSHAEIVRAHTRPIVASYYALREPGTGNLDMCSDEAGPAMALLPAADGARPPKESIWERFDRAGVEQRCTTFVDWAGCFENSTLDLKSRGPPGPAWHPHEFVQIDGWYLYKLVNRSILFARKFRRNASVATSTGPRALARVLPSYWAEAEFRPGLRPRVLRLDSTGVWGSPSPSSARKSTNG